ncbi:hypothetical protein EDC01DRAFT_627789 [Geopyxis carbonaria]|nr:hypothetical protein EDC01DRAFT_627789 [Geopyxis carbonaria]
MALIKIECKRNFFLALAQGGRQAEKPNPTSTAGKEKISIELVSVVSIGKYKEGEQGPKTYGHPSETWGWTPPSRFRYIPEWAREPLRIEKVRVGKSSRGFAVGFQQNRTQSLPSLVHSHPALGSSSSHASGDTPQQAE